MFSLLKYIQNIGLNTYKFIFTKRNLILANKRIKFIFIIFCWGVLGLGHYWADIYLPQVLYLLVTLSKLIAYSLKMIILEELYINSFLYNLFIVNFSRHHQIMIQFTILRILTGYNLFHEILLLIYFFVIVYNIIYYSLLYFLLWLLYFLLWLVRFLEWLFSK